MKRCFLFFCILILFACGIPVSYTNQPLQTYDKDTEYRIDDIENGFTINIYYSRYQMFPESSVVAASCKSALTSIAYEYAEAKGKKIKPINEQRIKISMGRSEFTGITSCSAMVKVEYE